MSFTVAEEKTTFLVARALAIAAMVGDQGMIAPDTSMSPGAVSTPAAQSLSVGRFLSSRQARSSSGLRG